ncbi:MAG: SAM-dependent methyltransferase, partial [Acidobacteriota bacterium]
MGLDNYARFANLRFDDFRKMARDKSLSVYEKIGFPDSYRKGKEEAIFADIVAKLPALSASRRVVVDIGPGCSDLPRMLIDSCAQQGHNLILVDSEEMLSQLPDAPHIDKIAARYPECPSLFDRYT